jgi:hypothetical protein
MGYNSILIPDGANEAITTSTSTAPLNPDGALVIELTGSGGVDVASLPAPNKYTTKATETPADTTPYTELKTYVYPDVIIGQLLLVTAAAISGGSITISATNETGTAVTYEYNATGDTLLLEAQASGYKVLFNNSVTVT